MSRWVDRALSDLERKNRLRGLLPLSPRSAVHVEAAGRPVTLFSSNDYLGLSMHPTVREAAATAAAQWGMGPRGSALICGYTDAHAALEADLAALKGTEAALVFPTGYAANIGVLSALGSPQTEIFSDALNHASIIDGCRLARCPVQVYRHADMDHLEALLAASTASRKVIATDALFSMDGDAAPLRALAELKVRYDATLVVDEAHATLLYGATGAGLIEATGTGDSVDFQVGTLSKAVGAQGGFIACSRQRRTWLLNTARSYVFSTALPIPVIEAARAALDVAADGVVRGRLWDRVGELSDGLGRTLTSPIAPIILGEEAAALAAGRALLEAGIHATPIRPPTVPPGTCRLRVTVSAAHQTEDVAALVAALKGLP